MDNQSIFKYSWETFPKKWVHKMERSEHGNRSDTNTDYPFQLLCFLKFHTYTRVQVSGCEEAISHRFHPDERLSLVHAFQTPLAPVVLEMEPEATEKQALLIANSIERGRPPGIKRVSNSLKDPCGSGSLQSSRFRIHQFRDLLQRRPVIEFFKPGVCRS